LIEFRLIAELPCRVIYGSRYLAAAESRQSKQYGEHDVQHVIRRTQLQNAGNHLKQMIVGGHALHGHAVDGRRSRSACNKAYHAKQPVNQSENNVEESRPPSVPANPK
jgi:hypothetical protein